VHELLAELRPNRVHIPELPRRHRRTAVLGIYALITLSAYAAAFLLRFDFAVPWKYWQAGLATLPVLLAIRLSVLAAMGVDRGAWRYAGIRDLMSLAWATTLSSLVFVVALFMTRLLEGLPRSVLLLEWLVFFMMAGGARFAVRCLHEGGGQFQRRPPTGRRTIVIGAGEAAEQLLRDGFRSNGSAALTFIGLLDDAPHAKGLELHGIPVLGGIDQIPALVSKFNVELLVIAIPSATGEQMRRIVRLCADSGVEFKILPSLSELLDGKAEIGQLRDVSIDDLLGRAPVNLALDQVRGDLADTTVLVTGGAGSIGAELARQVASFGPARLVLLDQAESPLYFTHLEIAKTHPSLNLVPIIGDVTDARRIDEVFAEYQPDFVFHAAAYKHVPLCEGNLAEALRNNVLGTLQVAECAAKYRARRFVLISTDKAVNPSSIMGASKRLAERIVLAWPSLAASSTDFRAVRFGNVLGSDGSVIPLFKKQLAAGGPLTVTHPEVRRYFMSIPEAVQLVLQAAVLPDAAGRITMLDMGEPVRILDLAEQLIRLTGLVPYRDIRIVFTGLRPGEKLFEELTTLLESSAPTIVDKIRIVHTDGGDGAGLQLGVTRLQREMATAPVTAVIRELRRLVPEYVPRSTVDGVTQLNGDRPAAVVALREPPLVRHNGDGRGTRPLERPHALEA
jgi:FlaA1/EpsC-like NDP-sugar epimerase